MQTDGQKAPEVMKSPRTSASPQAIQDLLIDVGLRPKKGLEIRSSSHGEGITLFGWGPHRLWTNMVIYVYRYLQYMICVFGGS